MAVCDRKVKGEIGDVSNACNWVVRSSKESWQVKEVERKSERGAYVSRVSAGKRYVQTCFNIYQRETKWQ